MEDNIKEVLSKLVNSGYEAYIVGGYVRDYLRGKKNFDIDICTSARCKDVLKIFKDEKITSTDYGNVSLSISNLDFTITTFRKDLEYKDNRHPVKFLYANTLDEDILRRDFTINTICMDIDGNIIDLLGAKQDLKKKVIKTVGDPHKKIKEDSLRILRAVRFATVLNFKIDENLKQAIIANKEDLKQLSYDRKKQELNKIFSSENKKYGVKLLKELALLEPLDLINIDNVLKTRDLIGMWATITPDNTYSFTKPEKTLIKNIKELLDKDLTNNYVLYRYGIYPCSIVCDLKGISKRKITNLYNKLPIKERKEINIEAEDICSIIGKDPNSILKDIYDILEEEILNKRLENKEEKLKDYVKSIKSIV